MGWSRVKTGVGSLQPPTIPIKPTNISLKDVRQRGPRTPLTTKLNPENQENQKFKNKNRNSDRRTHDRDRGVSNHQSVTNQSPTRSRGDYTKVLEGPTPRRVTDDVAPRPFLPSPSAGHIFVVPVNDKNDSKAQKRIYS